MKEEMDAGSLVMTESNMELIPNIAVFPAWPKYHRLIPPVCPCE